MSRNDELVSGGLLQEDREQESLPIDVEADFWLVDEQASLVGEGVIAKKTQHLFLACRKHVGGDSILGLAQGYRATCRNPLVLENLGNEF